MKAAINGFGRIGRQVLRIPVSCGSICDFTCVVEKKTSIEQVNDAMRRYSEGTMTGSLLERPSCPAT